MRLPLQVQQAVSEHGVKVQAQAVAGDMRDAPLVQRHRVLARCSWKRLLSSTVADHSPSFDAGHSSRPFTRRVSEMAVRSAARLSRHGGRKR